MRNDPENVRREWRIADARWEDSQPWLPPRTPPLGGHRPRVEARRAMEASCFVLRTGGPWPALQDPGLWSRRSAPRRVHAWAAAGVFRACGEQGLAAYAALQGMAWAGLAMAGAMPHAPLGGNRGASTQPTAGRWAPNGACAPTTAAGRVAAPWRAPRGMTARWSRRRAPVSRASAPGPPVLRKNYILMALDVTAPNRDNKQERSPRPQREAFAMIRLMRFIHHLGQFICTLLMLLGDSGRYLMHRLRAPAALAAENLFLRKQLALYRERGIKPRRATPATRLALIWLARWFDWRQALVVMQPATLIRWHRQGFRLFWHWTSRHGRPPIPAALQALIRQMARENPAWGQERITNELLLKLGLRVSPRTVRK